MASFRILAGTGSIKKNQRVKLGRNSFYFDVSGKWLPETVNLSQIIEVKKQNTKRNGDTTFSCKLVDGREFLASTSQDVYSKLLTKAWSNQKYLTPSNGAIDEMLEVRELLDNGKKIQAIKRYRAISGKGLKEAKKFIDNVTETGWNQALGKAPKTNSKIEMQAFAKEERVDASAASRLRFGKKAAQPTISLAAKELISGRPDAWEYRLFATVLDDEIAQQALLLRDYEGGLSSGSRINLQKSESFFRWLEKKMDDAEQFCADIEDLLNNKLPVALGPPGSPGDADAIIEVARKVGNTYRQAIEWALDIRRVSTEPRFQNILSLFERLVEDMIPQIREFSETLSSSLQAALTSDSPGQKQIELILKVTLPPGVVEDIDNELKAIKTGQAAASAEKPIPSEPGNSIAEMKQYHPGGPSMNNAELEQFYEKITMDAVTDTVEKLLTHPFGFHGDTGIRDYLFARLHVHGDQALVFDDEQGRPGFSTMLLQSEHYTVAKYRNTGQTGNGARFDLALTLPPATADTIENSFAENLEAVFAFELGKNKQLGKVIDRETSNHSADTVTGTSDVSKLYRELRDHGLRQGWAIEFYDSRMPGAAIIEESLDICRKLDDIEAGKKLVVIFVGFSADGKHFISSNDSGVQASLIGELGRRGIAAGPDLAAHYRKPAPSYRKGGWGSTAPSATVEEVFGDRADFANRIIRLGGVEEAGRASQYVNLSTARKQNIAQLHPQATENGIGFVLPSRKKAPPETILSEIPVSSLTGCKGTNKSWLNGAGKTFERKGPAIAYLIPDEVDELGDDDPAWLEVAKLLEHAKTFS